MTISQKIESFKGKATLRLIEFTSEIYDSPGVGAMRKYHEAVVKDLLGGLRLVEDWPKTGGITEEELSYCIDRISDLANIDHYPSLLLPYYSIKLGSKSTSLDPAGIETVFPISSRDSSKIVAFDNNGSQLSLQGVIQNLYSYTTNNAVVNSILQDVEVLKNKPELKQLTAAQVRDLYESNADVNRFTDLLSSKLSGVEFGATADQTGGEIKGLYITQPKAFTDALYDKLIGIEDSAGANYTALEIKSLYESNVNTNVLTDGLLEKLQNLDEGATGDLSASEIKNLYESNSNTNAFTDAYRSKLDGIEAGAEVNPDGVEIKSLYSAQPKAFTDVLYDKLAGIAEGAGATLSGAQIKALYSSETKAFTDVLYDKLVALPSDTDLSGKEDKVNKGQPSGYASLDSNATLSRDEIPDNLDSSESQSTVLNFDDNKSLEIIAGGLAPVQFTVGSGPHREGMVISYRIVASSGVPFSVEPGIKVLSGEFVDEDGVESIVMFAWLRGSCYAKIDQVIN